MPHITAKQLEPLQRLMASGTSEGSTKGWDTRGRGRKEKFVLSDKATGNRVHDALGSLGYSEDMSKRNMPGGTRYSHPDGYEAQHESLGGRYPDTLTIKDGDADHLGDVERELGDRGLLHEQKKSALS